MKFYKALTTLIVLTLLGTQHTYSQVDDTKKKKTISIKPINVKPIKKTGSFNLESNNGFKKAYYDAASKRNKIAQEKALKYKGIITPEMLKHSLLKKNLEKHNLKIPMIDKDLGAFRTKSENINIICYDHGIQDGDKINVILNNKIVLQDYTLKNNAEVFTFPLIKGFNTLEIKAIHEGDYRPNTGGFKVFDDNRKTVISNNWGLAKGARVLALIIRE